VDIVVLSQCRKEISEFPQKIKEELFDALRDLKEGLRLTSPLSKRMSGMGPGVFELRFKEVSGIFRVIYLMKQGDAIYLVHGFQKKATKTPRKNIQLALKRIKGIR